MLTGCICDEIWLIICLSILFDTLSFKEKNKYTYIHLDQGLVFINSKECKIITEKLYLVDKQDKELATPLKLI
ncbi:hypothetical protein V2P53_03355 [Mycoplasma capricolum subsp. capricolum]|uniref:hypothetical protein n=1 Tax=Mycoplasma capricolum TaxID=2095 RepID=UPI003DA2B199